MLIRPRRSVLYMPGSNARALEKAKTIDADALILDLEDAVAPDAKQQAREQVAAAVKGRGYGRRELVIRLNGAGTPWARDDLKAAIDAGPDGILIPKVNRPEDIADVAHEVNAAGAPATVRLWAMMETPLAMLNARDIAGAAADPQSRLAVLVMGTNDLAKETRASLAQDRQAMVPWLMTCVAAARAFGLDIVDGVYNDFRNEAGFRAECAQGRLFGFDGKTLIHPGQVAPCNDAFRPSDQEIASARTIIDAFDRPENAAKGAIELDGRMVERLHLDVARRTVAIAEAIIASETILT
ncbi:citrate lyase subunit beta/citryl-CoA lyase [Rhodoligotrophos appendicifer]|uniref:HpcH/HpaI aldolase/citrate lyase family protein n=1 Tax=Rhodoligotrophos appendicifer TaxID=987056 RepID=UPI00117EF1ED|nr:CoA ester lyase [Rhodoligotrophos appendicifer]